jgi:hypothetical protein
VCPRLFNKEQLWAETERGCLAHDRCDWADYVQGPDSLASAHEGKVGMQFAAGAEGMHCSNEDRLQNTVVCVCMLWLDLGLFAPAIQALHCTGSAMQCCIADMQACLCANMSGMQLASQHAHSLTHCTWCDGHTSL